MIGNSLKTEKSTGTSGICFRGRYTFKWRSEVGTMFRKQSQTQSNPVSDSMGIDRASATSKRIPCRVPVFKGLWREPYRVGGRSLVAQPEVATFLADHRLSEAGQHLNQPIAGHTARQLHAASKGINSSLT